MEKEIRITNELDEITALAIFVEEFCSDLSLPAETTMHINLALEEAAAYSGIGINKLREITNEDKCKFVLWVGNKRLIKRRLFDCFVEQAYSI